MSRYAKISRVDGNQKIIVEALRKAGAYIVHTHTIKKAFDIIAVFRGNTYHIEIKDEDKLIKGFKKMSQAEKLKYIIDNKLEEGEKDCMDEFERRGVRYYIVWNVKTALEVIGAHKPFFK